MDVHRSDMNSVPAQTIKDMRHSLTGVSSASRQGFHIDTPSHLGPVQSMTPKPARTKAPTATTKPLPRSPKLGRTPRKLRNADHRGRQVQALRGPGPTVRLTPTSTPRGEPAVPKNLPLLPLALL